jgi:hypothetical protein
MQSQTPSRGGPQTAPQGGLVKDPTGKFYWSGYDWKQIVPSGLQSAPSTAPSTDPTGKFYWTGKEWKPQPQPKAGKPSLFDTFRTGAQPTSTGSGGTGSSPDRPFGASGQSSRTIPARMPGNDDDLVVGQTYHITLNDGTPGMGVWNGSNFDPL